MTLPAGHSLVGHVASLHCFPIKSCGGMFSDVAVCTKSGFLKISNVTDRHCMIVRPNGDFITLRQKAKMGSIKTAVDGDTLVLTSDFMKTPCHTPLVPLAAQESIMDCRVWKNRLDGQDCGDDVAKWLSECLEEPGLRLVLSRPEMKRREMPHPNAHKETEVAYQDEGPMLVATTASLADLKSKISSSDDITMTNFRPNLVIETTQPWDEDNWSSISIGENVHLKVLYGCGRCAVPTIDLKDYERRKDGEPLKTLKSFRIIPEVNKSSPLFGIFCSVESEGTIKTGDPVYAMRKL